MIATCVMTLAANERSADGGPSQQSNARTAQSVIHAPNAYVDVLNGFARNGFDCTAMTGFQKKGVRRNALDQTCPGDSAWRNVDKGARAGRHREGVLAPDGQWRCRENPEKTNT
jgi:hypothetical protein